MQPNLKQNSFRKSAEAHLQKNLTSNQESASVKVRESIRGEKGVEEDLLFSMILLRQRKKEVLECQFAIAS